jgi:demethylmenaquinone methyltransferase/2-methoxy-6-polyprenyl-1,4-benzoquinol methylase
MEAQRQEPTLHVIAADFTFEMIQVGRRRPGGERLGWCGADALHLPFPDATFNAVTSGYLIRNVFDIRQAFEEQVRVIKPGGRVLCLETSPPPRSALRPFLFFYFKTIIPLLGSLVAGDRAAYTYLPDSTEAFITPENLASIMRVAGLQDVSYQQFMLGTQMICTGTRPQEP